VSEYVHLIIDVSRVIYVHSIHVSKAIITTELPTSVVNCAILQVVGFTRDVRLVITLFGVDLQISCYACLHVYRDVYAMY
jgi:hypothetical protein